MTKKALTAAVLTGLVLTSNTALAAKNPFKDLPADHWAYDAVTMLAEDGVLEGYGDDTFRGDKLLNRYEMAEIVSKALEKYDIAKPADKGAMRKLQNEFAEELKDMDVRLKAVENDVAQMKKGMSSFKWWGDARVRYFQNKNLDRVSGPNADSYDAWARKDKSELRMRLGFYGEPAEKLSVTGQLKFESTDSIASNDGTGAHARADTKYERVGVNRLQLDWHAKNDFVVSVGRNEISLGQGLLYWENPIDAVMVRKNFADKASLLVGYGDAAAGTWTDNSDYAFFADLSYKISPAVTLTTAYYNSHSDDVYNHSVYTQWPGWGWNWIRDEQVKRNLQQFAYGFNAQLAPKWNLIAEGVHNSGDVNRTNTYTRQGNELVDAGADDRNGWWTRLTYGNMEWNKGGTWKVYAEYMQLGGLAVDSKGWAHRLNVAGGNGYGGSGAKGFGLGFDYMLAPNTNLEIVWYKLKPYSDNDGIDNYKDTGFAALTYSF